MSQNEMTLTGPAQPSIFVRAQQPSISVYFLVPHKLDPILYAPPFVFRAEVQRDDSDKNFTPSNNQVTSEEVTKKAW